MQAAFSSPIIAAVILKPEKFLLPFLPTHENCESRSWWTEYASIHFVAELGSFPPSCVSS